MDGLITGGQSDDLVTQVIRAYILREIEKLRKMKNIGFSG